jgi:Uma2 family endonuclease
MHVMAVNKAPVAPQPSPSQLANMQCAVEPETAPDDLILWRLSLEQYHAMARAGILTENDPVELLEGWLVYKMTKNPPHSVVTQLTQNALRQILPGDWFVSSQEPITLDNSEPEPDITIVRGAIRGYLSHHPGADDIALVVEVADSTLRIDRGFKKRIYARAGISTYWIINLVDKQIEVYSQPTGPSKCPDYHVRRDYLPADELPVIIDDREIGRLAVKELLP